MLLMLLVFIFPYLISSKSFIRSFTLITYKTRWQILCIFFPFNTYIFAILIIIYFRERRLILLKLISSLTRSSPNTRTKRTLITYTEFPNFINAKSLITSLPPAKAKTNVVICRKWCGVKFSSKKKSHIDLQLVHLIF